MSEKEPDWPQIPERLPARLTSAQAALVLGFKSHDIRILVAARLLKPLGNPPPHAVRFFSAGDILELLEDRNWLSKATNVIYQHWSNKNHSPAAEALEQQAA